MKNFTCTIIFAILFVIFATSYCVLYPRFVQPQLAVQQFETNNSSLYMTTNNASPLLMMQMPGNK